MQTMQLQKRIESSLASAKGNWEEEKELFGIVVWRKGGKWRTPDGWRGIARNSILKINAEMELSSINCGRAFGFFCLFHIFNSIKSDTQTTVLKQKDNIDFPPPTFVFLCCSRQLLCATCKSRGDIRRKDERPWEPKRVEKAEHRDGCEWKESSSSRGTGHQNESEYEWTKKNGKSRGWREKWKMPPANKIESRLEYGTGRRGAGPVVRAHAGHVRRQAAAVFHYARSRERETANWEKSRIEQRKPERRKMDRMDAGRPYRKNSAVQTT